MKKRTLLPLLRPVSPIFAETVEPLAKLLLRGFGVACEKFGSANDHGVRSRPNLETELGDEEAGLTGACYSVSAVASSPCFEGRTRC